MKSFLQDLVAHTHTLGVLPIIRVTASPNKTIISSVTEDRKMLLNAVTNKPVANINGVFGMSGLNKLDLHLKCPEYKENAQITIVTEVRDGEETPTGIHFQNESGDFQNDYRFMSRKIVDMKMREAEFLGTKWDIEFEPTEANIQRFKFQSTANSEEALFQVSTSDGNLIFSLGDLNTHSGSFVFEADVSGSLKTAWKWPRAEVLNVLNLVGDKTMRIANAGAMQITVNSGLIEYNYTFPAQSK